MKATARPNSCVTCGCVNEPPHRTSIEHLMKIFQYRRKSQSAEASGLSVCRCTHTHQTLQTFQNLQTNLLGGGFTLPLHPPTASARRVANFSWRPRGALDPSKKHTKTRIKSTFSLFGPNRPPHVPIICPKWSQSDPKVVKSHPYIPKMTPK